MPRLFRGKRGRTLPSSTVRHSDVRWVVRAMVCLLVASNVSVATAFDLSDVAKRARALAAEPFVEPDRIPRWLLDLDYNAWRGIRFRPEYALWRSRNLAFEVQFFHPGLYYDRAVAINVVDADGIRPVAFNPSMFDYDVGDIGSRVPQNLGFAGFRLHYPIKRRDYKDEVIVFLGATYFRAVGRDQGFGASMRALAIDTGLPSGEEFPFFREFWLVRPTSTADAMAIYALSDSLRTTGAFRFVVTPGTQTVVQVDARIYLREPVVKLGLAPVTSMFLHGENTTRCVADFRPEVHDSDGMLLHLADQEWLWRPLDNPERLSINSFLASDPKGFGLLQRDREFDHYQDLETRPELRPSVWIVPATHWGDGHVEVLEIPSDQDYNDNMVVFWVPERADDDTRAIEASYSVYWYGDDDTRPSQARVVSTRRQPGTKDGRLRFVVDFEGARLAQLEPATVLRAVITVASGKDSGEIVERHVVKNPVTGGWRMSFELKPESGDPIELRAFLDLGGNALTETWTYTVEP